MRLNRPKDHSGDIIVIAASVAWLIIVLKGCAP